MKFLRSLQNEKTTLHQLMLSVLVVLVITYPTSTCSANDKAPNITLVLGSSFIEPLSTPSMDGFVDLIAKEAFKRIGINVISQQLPSERSLKNANAGVLDGDILRVNNINTLYPNLVKVPETIMTLDFVAFTNTVQLPSTNWKTIQPLSIGLIRGWKILEINTMNAKQVTKVKNATLLFTLLKKQRADIILYERYEGYGKIKQLNLKEVRTLEPALASKEMFMYLNIKHANLVPKLVKEIRAMKKDGVFERIRISTLLNIIPRDKKQP